MNNDPGPDNPIEARIREFLLLWEEARERGEILSAAELCRDGGCSILTADIVVNSEDPI